MSLKNQELGNRNKNRLKKGKKGGNGQKKKETLMMIVYDAAAGW